ncbi:Imm64 family immunity protein [Cohnella laeviribosi]|uniref:Imm64 family immunity protein n=1 Tax=Cohnella laeviribosi TaxID=380174 RepID=UPI003D20C505
MSSTVNIGFIYDNKIEFFSEKLYKIINYFISDNGKIKSMKYATNEEGANWIEQINGVYELDSLVPLITNYYGEVVIDSGSLFSNVKKIYMNLEKNEDYLGVIISLQENEIIPDYSVEVLENASEFVISIVKEIYQITSFRYAFCDHEAEIIFPLDMDKYSLVFIPNSNDKDITVKKNKWYINGLTERI